MNFFLIQAILIAGIGDEDSRFWVQILVLLIVAVGWGVYSLVKNDLNRHKARQQNLAEETCTHYAKSRWQFQLPHKPDISSLSQEPMPDLDNLGTADRKDPKKKLAAKKTRDLRTGMDLLELDFLLSVVENTKGNAQNDITMRKLNFKELLRRGKLSRVDSKPLTVYAVNRGDLYGKDIQCKATEELAQRTMRTNRPEPPLLSVSTKKRKRMLRVK
jgi:hypothetical protein